MYRGSRLRSTLNTSYITGLDMCQVCTEAVDCVALWTRVTLQVWTCVKYVPRQSIAQHFEHELHYRFGHVSSMYRGSRLRSTLNTSYITGLDMCQVCTEAVDCVALRIDQEKTQKRCPGFRAVGKNNSKTCFTNLDFPDIAENFPYST